MHDFTLETFRRLLTSLKSQNYTFQTFAEFLKNPTSRSIILRHDVDARKMNSLKTAQLEMELGITGTYYFRIVPESFDEEVIKQIAAQGHEIGYHYEDLSMCAARGWRPAIRSKFNKRSNIKKGPQDQVLPNEELVARAIITFRENLEKLRRVVPVETICMHGSPLSKYDNRMLWEKYDYRKFGIVGEPYFDINFKEVLYITDTGRRWNGESVSIRDKTIINKWTKGIRDLETKGQKYKENRKPVLSFRSTFDIINAAEERSLPDRIMITVHPQRWDNRPLPWIKEFVWQNIKNTGKRVITNMPQKDR